MTRKQIDSKDASVAATFYEPVYQRLRLWHRGRELNLLCFVKPSNESVTKLLSDCGAIASSTFRAKCFPEIWELPADTLQASRFGQQPTLLDQTICHALGCHAGAYSAEAGHIQWSDIHEAPHRRRRIPSKLLAETSSTQLRNR